MKENVHDESAELEAEPVSEKVQIVETELVADLHEEPDKELLNKVKKQNLNIEKVEPSFTVSESLKVEEAGLTRDKKTVQKANLDIPEDVQVSVPNLSPKDEWRMKPLEEQSIGDITKAKFKSSYVKLLNLFGYLWNSRMLGLVVLTMIMAFLTFSTFNAGLFGSGIAAIFGLFFSGKAIMTQYSEGGQTPSKYSRQRTTF